MIFHTTPSTFVSLLRCVRGKNDNGNCTDFIRGINSYLYIHTYIYIHRDNKIESLLPAVQDTKLHRASVQRGGDPLKDAEKRAKKGVGLDGMMT